MFSSFWVFSGMVFFFFIVSMFIILFVHGYPETVRQEDIDKFFDSFEDYLKNKKGEE
jgi:hypothetical protein